MTAKKQTSKTGPVQKDGKKGPSDQLQENKKTAKYTINRSKEDLEILKKVRQSLKTNINYCDVKTDSKIYRILPKLYLNAVKENQDLQLAIDELTAKLDQLEDLRTSFCRINEICKVK